MRKSQCEVAKADTNRKKDKERTCLKNTAEVFFFVKNKEKRQTRTRANTARAEHQKGSEIKTNRLAVYDTVVTKDCSHGSTLAPILSFIDPDTPPVIDSGIITV